MTKEVATKKANANPTKAFFVRMITKDITLEDCILDLIDNCVDGAWQGEGGQPISLSSGVNLGHYAIEIEFDEDGFRITDNCGGITLDEAANYAFTFGRKEEEPQDKYSIGVYGIGMKRAIFKMGRNIEIRSTYQGNEEKESFKVPIDVNKWLEEDSSAHWDFDIEPSSHLESMGVEIIVSDLNESTAEFFRDPAFEHQLRRTIARDYALHMHNGLTVKLNGKQIDGWQIKLRQGGQFEPMRIKYNDGFNNGSVLVEILAGMAAPPPEDSEPDSKDKGESRSGWYVVCNGRIVLAADKSMMTGWGTENWPKWHPQYIGFMGFLFFSSENAALLPLTTTKRNVDVSSTVYRQALPKMREVSRAWIDYTNVRKQTLVEAKAAEIEAKATSVYDLPQKERVRLPSFAPKQKKRMANISYAVPVDKVDSLRRELGDVTMTYRDVGLATFDYTYEDHVGEGDE